MLRWVFASMNLSVGAGILAQNNQGYARYYYVMPLITILMCVKQLMVTDFWLGTTIWTLPS